MDKVIIIDGYNDEPAGFGVSPYLDVYARYTAGAIWSYNNKIKINYYTIDEARANFNSVLKEADASDILIVLGGTVVPGKYIGGTPITATEAIKIGKVVTKPIKILGGPAAKFGFGGEGGKKPKIPKEIALSYDLIVKGDIEIVTYNLLQENLHVDVIEPYMRRTSYQEISNFAVKGARIIKDHPNYKRNLICEIETYRGCPRSITGGCSFCAETLYGLPTFRPIKDIIKEIEALYTFGARNFRLGRQPDIYSYMSKGVGEKEFPLLNPEAIRKLFLGIRKVAPNVKMLHIDNANPGAIARYPDRAREITKIIVEYHTSGDVAAMGVETADEKVIKANNLKASPEESFRAIKIVNEIGSRRGSTGMPELLPGINFVYGLMGETKETYNINLEFMKSVLHCGLLVRRINIRQCIPLPGTKMWNVGTKIIHKHKRYFKIYKERMRKEVDLPMLKKIIPEYSVLKDVFLEKKKDNIILGRQVGSYPILVTIPFEHKLNKFVKVMVTGHGYRSVTGVLLPIKINVWSKKELTLIPGIGDKLSAKIIKERPFKNTSDLGKIIRKRDLLERLKENIVFDL